MSPAPPSLRIAAAVALVAAFAARGGHTVQQSSGNQSSATQSRPAPIVRSTPAPVVRPFPSPATPPHLQQAFPVRQNSDGSTTLVKPQTAPGQRPSPETPQTPAASQPQPPSSEASPGAAAPVPAAPLKPPPPPDPAVLAGYLAALPAPAFNRTTVVLDPAHGGGDSGASIADGILEKDVDLAFALKLRSLLVARGFTVVLTRDSDAAADPGNPTAPLTLDTRAGIANRAFASACLLLHATATGQGVHLYTSELAAVPVQPLPTPWLTAQAAWSRESQQLEAALGSALTRSHVQLVASKASVRPVDSLTCPALVVELAPSTSEPASLADGAYQQRVAESLAAALVFWQTHAQPQSREISRPTTTAKDGQKSAEPHRPAKGKPVTPKPAPTPSAGEPPQ